MWIVVCIGLTPPVFAQTTPQADAPTATHRIFLTSGEALPAYGESARVDDRIAFMLVIGEGAAQQLQLMSLPVTAVDLDRTNRYSEAVRASYYAMTRGEREYQSMTQEVGRAIDQLAGVQDKKQRLGMAEEARSRLQAWSRNSYNYRADDVRELSALFDEVIADLRTAAGESAVSFELQAGPAAPEYEPPQPLPSIRASVQLALSASMAADLLEDRVAVLRAAQLALGDGAEAADLRAAVANALAEENKATIAYGKLVSTFTARADAARRRADVATIESLLGGLSARDQMLGRRRPAAIRELRNSLLVSLARAREHRLALDHYNFVRRALLDYELQVRPVLASLDRLGAVLRQVRRQASVDVARLDDGIRTLTSMLSGLEKIAAPDDVAVVHAMLSSALQMAREACRQRRLAVVTSKISYAQDASAAAAGALLLTDQARQTLVQRLSPPAIQ
ncbi:MAG TPA: hypothetical protein VFV98_01975 [Vicinamibacterales bacterium]|nr:hypothetical protein [Vicinamibacterales bacterium]